MKAFTLYGLRKPGEEARYIGIACQTLKKRLTDHLREKKKYRKNLWLAKAKRENSVIEITSYCVGLTKEEACELERAVIAELRKLGLDLVNTAAGGEAAMFGRHHSEKTKNQLVEIGKSQWEKKSFAEKEKVSAVSRQYKHSEEAKTKISLAGQKNMVGNTNSLGHKNNSGGKHTPEWKAAASVRTTLYWEKKRQESYLAEMWGSRG